MRKVLILAGLGLMAGGMAWAQGTMPLSQVIRGLEDKGYVVTEVDVEVDEIEIEARSPSGQRVELDVDPATGAIRRERPRD